jgi:hypothetical protein
MPTRHYQGKDVDMLTSCATLIENALLNEVFLSGIRRSWSPPFFQNLRTRINAAFANYLGIDAASAQRKATQTLLQIQSLALDDIIGFNIQLKEDFKSDKPRCTEILKQLGYADFYKQAKTRDQEGLTQLLYRFRTNLTPDLRSEITAKGIDTDCLDRISSYADRFTQANIAQETSKGAKKLITAEALTEFNAIYDEVISIAKIAHYYYKGFPGKRDQFSYRKIRKALNASSSSRPPTEAPQS